MRRPNRRQLARWLRQANEKLADPALDDVTRATFTQRADALRRQLVGSCSNCGRTLTDPTSVALGIGPECRARTLDQADADDRAYDAAVCHELSA
jgi:hypothetical protein